MSRNNRTLGRFCWTLGGILPTPRGISQIQVIFDIDVNGIFSVKFLDKGNGKEQKITINASSGLSKDEIKKMLNEAKEYACKDDVEIRNYANKMTYLAEKTLLDNRGKIPESLNKEIEGKINSLLDSVNGTNIEIMKKATQDLNNVLQQTLLSLMGIVLL